jgi:hypothetical protein
MHRRSPVFVVTATIVATVCSAVVVAAADGGISFFHRYAFVTSVSGTGNLGDPTSWPDNGGLTGLAAADAVCRARATAAGLPLPNEFIAWMSDSSNDAYCRIHGYSGTKAGNCGGLPSLPSFAGPWIRTDGHPFAAVIDEALDPTGRVYVPVRLDEYGAATGGSAHFTGSDAYGVYVGSTSAACSDWTSATTDQTFVGSPNRSSHSWSLYGSTNCSSNRELLCMHAGGGPDLPSILNYGGLAFVTSASGAGRIGDWADSGGHVGIEAADAVCRSRAAAGGLRFPESFKAWLSTSSVDAVDRFTFNGPWVRLDGVLIAESKADLVDGEIFGPINQDELGTYIQNYSILTGTESDGTWGNDDCAGWTSSLATDDVIMGRANGVLYWTDQGYSSGCNLAGRLFCLSEVAFGPVVFYDDFETATTGAWSTTSP